MIVVARTLVRCSLFNFLLCVLFTELAYSAPTVFPSRLISTEWLNRNLNTQNLYIVDARPAQMYQQGHIQNAISLPADSTFSTSHRTDLIASVTHLKRLFSEAGISNTADILAYDDGEFINAARLIWVLESMGHKRVALLDGGLPAWKKSGGSISNDPVIPTRARFIPRPDPTTLSTQFDTRLALASQFHVILDVREPEEYLGRVRKTARSGHIPNAINIPWKNAYYEKDGITQLKSIKELRRMYSSIPLDQHVIVYCHKGKQSALTHFVLKGLGYRVSTYDGSWYEWGNDPRLPVIQPDP